jgi:hypothetical protein
LSPSSYGRHKYEDHGLNSPNKKGDPIQIRAKARRAVGMVHLLLLPGTVSRGSTSTGMHSLDLKTYAKG